MDEPFITEEPWKLMQKGKFQRVPLLIGYTANEGMYMCQGTYFLHYYMTYETRRFKGSPIVPILSRINPIPCIDMYLFKTHSNFVFPSTPRPP
jgi:Carboxylesterase.